MQEHTAGGISALGIDVKAIIFQIVNFVLLLLILKWAAYQPILKVLDERRRKIADSLKTAQALEQKQRDWEKKTQQLRAETLAKSEEILQASQEQAKKDSAEILAKTHSQQERIIQKTRAQLGLEKTRLLKEAKSQIGELVALATAKILKQKIGPEQDKQLIKQSLQQIDSETKSKDNFDKLP